MTRRSRSVRASEAGGTLAGPLPSSAEVEEDTGSKIDENDTRRVGMKRSDDLDLDLMLGIDREVFNSIPHDDQHMVLKCNGYHRAKLQALRPKHQTLNPTTLSDVLVHLATLHQKPRVRLQAPITRKRTADSTFFTKANGKPT